jgi:phage terminase small subunit
MAHEKGLKNSELSQKEKDFVSYYCDPASKTYHQKIPSFTRAGYADTRSARYNVSRLITSDKIERAIAEYTAKNTEISSKRQEINREYSLACLQETWESSKNADDRTNMVACARLMCQINGLLVERMVVDVEDSRRLDESHRAQAKRIAAFMVNHGLLNSPAPNLIPASFEPVSCETQTQSDTPQVVDAADNNTDSYGQNDKSIDNQ